MNRLGKLVGLLLMSLLSNVATASDAQHGINWWHLGSAYKDAPAMGFLIITFLIFVYGCIRAIRKPLSLYLETRSKDIRRQIEEGQIAKAKSEEKLKLYDEKLKSLGSEVERLKAAFSEQAQSEKIERDRLAKEVEARILQDADDTIRANYERSKNRLADEVIKQALALAEESIKANRRDQVDEFLKSAFIDDLKSSAKEVH